VKGFWKTLFLYSAAGHVRPQLKERGCDTVLPDKGYRTSQAAVIAESGTMMEG
jgi:hypothetical protein